MIKRNINKSVIYICSILLSFILVSCSKEEETTFVTAEELEKYLRTNEFIHDYEFEGDVLKLTMNEKFYNKTLNEQYNIMSKIYDKYFSYLLPDDTDHAEMFVGFDGKEFYTYCLYDDVIEFISLGKEIKREDIKKGKIDLNSLDRTVVLNGTHKGKHIEDIMSDFKEQERQEIYSFMKEKYDELTNYGENYVPEIHDQQVAELASKKFGITVEEAKQIYTDMEMYGY
jgi:hypothetical protein